MYRFRYSKVFCFALLVLSKPFFKNLQFQDLTKFAVKFSKIGKNIQDKIGVV